MNTKKRRIDKSRSSVNLAAQETAASAQPRIVVPLTFPSVPSGAKSSSKSATRSKQAEHVEFSPLSQLLTVGCGTKDKRVRIRCLVEVSRRLEDVESFFNKASNVTLARMADDLCFSINSEPDPDICSYLLTLVQRIVEIGTASGDSSADQRVSWISTLFNPARLFSPSDSETTEQLVAHALNCVTTCLSVIRCKDKNVTVWPALLRPYEERVAELCTSRVAIVRAEAIALVSVIAKLCLVANCDVPFALDTAEGVGSLAAFASADADCRVRRQALRSLADLIEGNSDKGTLSPSCTLPAYEHCVRALSDDFEEVREVAVALVWQLSLVHADCAPPSSAPTACKSLAEAAFTAICGVASADLSKVVRARACALLGRFEHVGQAKLLQIFSKKLNEPTASTLAFGSKNFAVSVEGDVDVTVAGEINLLEATAAGAFVHGLEDEFEQVRKATVGAIGDLCSRTKSVLLAQPAFISLVDTLNDESEEVRIHAAQELSRLARNAGLGIVFDYEQLMAVLNNLYEASFAVRCAVRKLLECSQFDSAQCVRASVNALLLCIGRTPGDTPAAMRTLRCIGENHAELTATLVDEFLRLDRRFITSEPSMDDVYYVCIMVLLFGAARRNPADVIPRLPPHCHAHYPYLHEKYPELFPEKTLPGTVSTEPQDFLALPSRDLGVLLESASARLAQLDAMCRTSRFSDAMDLIRSVDAEASRVYAVKRDVSLELLSLRLRQQCQALVSVVIVKRWGVRSPPHVARELLRRAYLLEFGANKCADAELHVLQSWRIIAHVALFSAAAASHAGIVGYLAQLARAEKQASAKELAVDDISVVCEKDFGCSKSDVIALRKRCDLLRKALITSEKEVPSELQALCTSSDSLFTTGLLAQYLEQCAVSCFSVSSTTKIDRACFRLPLATQSLLSFNVNTSETDEAAAAHGSAPSSLSSNALLMSPGTVADKPARYDLRWPVKVLFEGIVQSAEERDLLLKLVVCSHDSRDNSSHLFALKANRHVFQLAEQTFEFRIECTIHLSPVTLTQCLHTKVPIRIEACLVKPFKSDVRSSRLAQQQPVVASPHVQIGDRLTYWINHV